MKLFLPSLRTEELTSTFLLQQIQLFFLNEHLGVHKQQVENPWCNIITAYRVFKTHMHSHEPTEVEPNYVLAADVFVFLVEPCMCLQNLKYFTHAIHGKVSSLLGKISETSSSLIQTQFYPENKDIISINSYHRRQHTLFLFIVLQKYTNKCYPIRYKLFSVI